MSVGPSLDPDNRTWEAIVAFIMLAFCYGVAAYRLMPYKQTLKGVAAKFLKQFRPRNKTIEDEDPLERRVREECERRHIQRANYLLILANLQSAGQYAFYLLNIFTDMPVVTLVQICICHAFFFIIAVMSLFPRALTKRTIDAIYCLAMLTVLALILTNKRDALNLNEGREAMLLSCLYWSLFNLKIWLNAIFLTLIAAAYTYMLTSVSHTCLCVLASYFFILVVLFGVDHILTEGVRLDLKGSDSKNELTAIRTLLNSICDVIVQLDASLCLRQHSPKLSDVLLQAPGRDLQGKDLREWMPLEADREAFTQRMVLADEEAAHADVFHVKMRDGTGSTVDMELFSVAFKAADAQQHHLLGMREYTDIQPMVAQSQRQPPPPPPMPVVMPKPNAIPEHWAGTPAAREQAPQGDIRSHAGSSSKGSRRSKASSGASSGRVSAVLRAGIALPETKELAKSITVSYMLMSWSFKAPEGACCPFHARITELQAVAAGMLSKPCQPGFGPVGNWQCRRCAIRSEEYKDPKNKKKCILCRDIDSALLNGSEKKGATLAL